MSILVRAEGYVIERIGCSGGRSGETGGKAQGFDSEQEVFKASSHKLMLQPHVCHVDVVRSRGSAP